MMTLTQIMNDITTWADAVAQQIMATPPAELAAATLAPVLAMIIGIVLNGRIDRWESRALYAKFLDFIGPLITPIFAVVFSAGAMSFYIHSGHKPFVLLLVFKLSIAWLAIHVVRIMSSGRTAAWFIAFIIIPITLLHLFEIWEPIVKATSELRYSFGETTISLYQVLRAAVILILMVSAVNFILDLTEGRLKRVRNLRASNRTLIMKFSQIGLYIVVFIFAMNLVGVSLTTLSIFSGALGVGIGFGLQKIASNFISGIILLFEKSIEVGDIIEIEPGITASVVRTSGRYTLVTTADGKDVMIPNEEFITQRVTSLTHTDKHSRIDIPVGVGYDDDIELALKLLLQASRETKRALKDPAPTAFAMAFLDSSVQLRLSFWVDDITDGKLQPQTEAMIAILRLFKEHNITIPYPHQVAVLPAEAGEHLPGMPVRKKLKAKAVKKDETARS